MRLLIFGATGGTGQLLVEGALKRGGEVTAVARRAESLTKMDHGSDRLTPASGDVRHHGFLQSITPDHQAAISVISGTARGFNGIYSEGTRAIVKSLEAEGVRRFICVSSGGVDSNDPGLPYWYRIAIPLFMREMYDDMRAMERAVRESSLDWTVVRSSYLVNRPARGTYRVADGRNPVGGWKIARADLAEFMLDELQANRWIKSVSTLAY